MITLSVNGMELGHTQDTLYPEGKTGFFFDTFTPGHSTNVSVRWAE